MPRLLHIGIHESKNRNAGDTVLFPVVRELFSQCIDQCTWGHRQLWEPFTLTDALAVNDQYDGVVIGGGGLLLRDQAGSDTSNSGWQWNSTVEAVKALRVPLFMFAVGYNRFRGQQDFDPVFTDHITATLRASRFFGLRNHGSIAAVKDYVPDDLHDRISLQQCPTTVLWQLYPQARQAANEPGTTQAPVLSVNAAFDREELRFGDAKASILETISASMKKAQDSGWAIELVAHKTKDLDIAPFLAAQDVAFKTVDLTDSPYQDVIDYYTRPSLVVGMRGHAQMIPFGLRKPIFSIISHNKMRYLLDDIGHPEWGADVMDPAFSEKLDAFVSRVFADSGTLQAQVVAAQEECWRKSAANMREIAANFAPQDG